MLCASLHLRHGCHARSGELEMAQNIAMCRPERCHPLSVRRHGQLATQPLFWSANSGRRHPPTSEARRTSLIVSPRPPHSCRLYCSCWCCGQRGGAVLLSLHRRTTTLWRVTPTLLPLLCVSSGNNLWPSAYMRSLVNAVEILFLASIAPPFLYIGTRALIFSFWSGCAYRDRHTLYRLVHRVGCGNDTRW